MINASDRGEAIKLIDEAVAAGARQAAACTELGLCERTVQRWRLRPHDGRPQAKRPVPRNKLSHEERQAILRAANRPDCANLTPHQIVPKLADEGVYLASESSFYRVLKAAGQGQRRGRSRAAKARALTTHRAVGANQVWCWDITWLPTTVKGRFFYWYMVKDIYSRKLIANEVHSVECAEHAAQLLRRGCLREQTAGRPLVLHSDNGAAMKGMTLKAANERAGRGALVQQAAGEQRQRLRRSLVPHRQVLPAVAGAAVRNDRTGARLGPSLRGLVQRRTPPQCSEIRHARAATSRRRPATAHTARRVVRGCASA
jgi:transposase InsO family protein